MMKIQTATMILTILVASIFTSLHGAAADSNHYSLTLHLDKSTYMQGETVKISGTVNPLKEKVPVTVEVVDPSSKVHLATKIMPESNGENIGLCSYQFELGKGAPAGIWTINAKYASEYMLYDSANIKFRIIDSIDIPTSPSLQVKVDGVVDSSSGEWAHKYDSKYWKPFEKDPSQNEGNVGFNTYYSNGVLYAVFDVPDKKFDAKDFVELGLDINNVGDKFKTGDEVYIFRVFRDGTYDSFRLGSEHLTGEEAVKHQFSAKAGEAGDIRVQVFDKDGNLVNALNSLRDKSSTSYKGIHGIAGLKVDREGNLYVLDGDSGIISKFNSEGRLLGSFGSLGTDFKEFVDPTGIALDLHGNLYIADTGNARVQKFDKDGMFIGAFGSMGLLSLGMAEAGYQKPEENKRHDLFESPEAIIVGLSGNLYVVDRRAGNVNIFDGNGNYIRSFGSLVSPRGIAMDSQGNIYVVEQGNNRVVKLDQNGNSLKTWGTFGIEDGNFKAPYGIAIDSNNDLYVADSGNNRIQKFSSDGTFITKWGDMGTGAGEFIGPHGLAVDSSGNIYVADTGNNRIEKFNPDGKFVGEFGSKGSNQGNFMGPEAIAIDSQGSIYVTDLYNKRVQKFGNDGSFLAEWGTEGVGAGKFRGPFGITIDASNNVYVTDPFNKRVQKFDTNGNLLLRWGSSDIKEAPSINDIPKGDHYIAIDSDSHEPVGVIDAKFVKEHGEGSYVMESGKVWKILYIFENTAYVKQVKHAKNTIPSWTPDGIAVDPSGNVYIVDRENEIAKKFDSNGNLISKWGSHGTGDGEFLKPTAMVLDSQDNVYIVDTGNNRMQKFDSDGKFIAKWGVSGQGHGQFTNPRGIAIDNHDNVYVLDNGNNRMQKFDSDGKFITEWGSKGSSPGQFENLSTEGMAVDSQGRIYVADMPGGAEATHWIAELAIPLFAKSETFGIFLGEGTYNEHLSQNKDKQGSADVYDVYRSTWPKGAISVLPGTWAMASLVDVEKMSVQTATRIDNIRACTDEVCNELEQSAKPVLTGNNVIVTASIAPAQASGKFEYDRAKVTLQYSLDGNGWMDAESKFVVVSREAPATVNLKWTPMDSGDVKLRVISSGILTKQSTSDLLELKVQEPNSLPIRANVKWSPSKIMQDEPTTFKLAFTGADNKALNNLSYDLKIIKDDKILADLPLLQAGAGNAVFHYTFKQPGSYIMQVRTIGIGSSSDFIPVKKSFNYEIDVLPVDSPVKISTMQKGESMKIMIKNRDTSNILISSINLSIANIDKIDFKLLKGWTSSVNTETKMIQFSTENDPLTPGKTMEFTVRSKLFTKSLYSVCSDLQQSTLVVKLC